MPVKNDSFAFAVWLAAHLQKSMIVRGGSSAGAGLVASRSCSTSVAVKTMRFPRRRQAPIERAFSRSLREDQPKCFAISSGVKTLGRDSGVEVFISRAGSGSVIFCLVRFNSNDHAA